MNSSKHCFWYTQSRQKVIGLVLIAVLSVYGLILGVGLGEPNYNVEQGNLGPLLVHIFDPHSNKMVLPNSVPLPGVKGTTLYLSACRGEIESASFVVRPLLRDVQNLSFEMTDLAGSAGSVSASRADLTVVKVWYQGGNAWNTISADKSEKLVPELLLHDDTLIRVDVQAKMNYARLIRGNVEAYESISDRRNAGIRQVIHSPESFPIKDEANLQPFDIRVQENKQLVVTVRVPREASPGEYEGALLIKESGQTLGSLAVKLTVYPFRLESPSLEYSIYYRGILTRDTGSISAEGKSEVQLRAELQNMWDHGVTNPTLYQPFGDKQLLRTALDIRRSIGMIGKPLYYLGVATGSPDNQKAVSSYVNAVRELKVIAREYELPEVYVYGIDEASPEMIRRQRKAWQMIREAGGKIFSAGWTPGHFELLGDAVDLFVDGQPPQKAEAEKFHRVKHRVFSYNTPQVGVENPFVYRKNYGIRLWQQEYDGAMTYAYQDGFGSIWNDFDHLKFRDHNFTYPTVDGVIDTLAWEGFREGVDDVRYIATLQGILAVSASDSREEVKAIVQEANAFLAELRGYGGDDLAGMRKRIVSYILRVEALKPGV